MSRDAELTFLLTYQGQEQQKSKLQGKLLLIEQLEEEAVSLPSNNLCLSFHALQMAYIIYTSGSTGNPKGVMATHASLHNLIASQIEIFNICDNDRLLLFASPGFDASISETFIALCAGATLSIASKEETLPGKIETFIQENQISCITCTPTILALLDAHACPSLCKIISAGEQCPPALIEKWSRNRLFFNAYGPTEATVCSTIACGQDCFPLHGQRTTSIGRPIANVQVYILDKYAQPVPVGVLGEIYIGGMGITRGYLHNPILTATTFIPDSFSSLSGSRLYKTGDIGLYLPDGRIEIRGRNDRQVKLRGFRIELNEIELYLDRHPIVQKSAVILQRDAVHQFRIVAYILKQSDSITIDGNINIVLRTYLQQYLPEYMLPAFYIEVDNLPTTTNGKVNYSALLLSDKSQLLPRITFVPPRQGLEQVVAAIWQEVLNLPDVGAHDNFFDLGGHSLLMAQVHEKLQSQLQLDIAIIDLFKYTTIAKLVEYIQGEQQQESQELEDFEETFSLRREAGKKRFQHQLAHRKSEQGEKRDHQ